MRIESKESSRDTLISPQEPRIKFWIRNIFFCFSVCLFVCLGGSAFPTCRKDGGPKYRADVKMRCVCLETKGAFAGMCTDLYLRNCW